MGTKYRGGQNFRVLVPVPQYGGDPSNSNAAFHPPMMRTTQNFAHGIRTPGAGLNAPKTAISNPTGLFEVVYGGSGGATDVITPGSAMLKLGDYTLRPWADYVPVSSDAAGTAAAIIAAINRIPGFSAAPGPGSYIVVTSTGGGLDTVDFGVQNFGTYDYFQNFWPAEGGLGHIASPPHVEILSATDLGGQCSLVTLQTYNSDGTLYQGIVNIGLSYALRAAGDTACYPAGSLVTGSASVSTLLTGSNEEYDASSAITSAYTNSQGRLVLRVYWAGVLGAGSKIIFAIARGAYISTRTEATCVVAGATKYLDKTNVNASNLVTSGTAAVPYLSLTYALTQAGANDAIVIPAAATYTEGATVWIAPGAIVGLVPGVIWQANNATRICQVNASNTPRLCRNIEFTMGTPLAQNYGFEFAGGVEDLAFAGCTITGGANLYAFNLKGNSTSFKFLHNTVTLTKGGLITDTPALTFSIRHNTITMGIGSGGSGCIYQGSAAPGGDVNITSNTITDLVGAYPVRFLLGGHNSISVVDNVLLGSATTNRNQIDLVDHKAYTVTGNTIRTVSGNIVAPISVRQPGGVAALATISDNTIDTYSIANYSIMFGGEGGATHIANALAGSTISGNMIYSGAYHGVGGANSHHSILCGNNKNSIVQGNITNGGAYGVVVKGASVWTAGGVLENTFLDSSLTCVRIKGEASVQVLDNTLSCNDATSSCLAITENTGPISTGTVFYRNNCTVVLGQAISVANDGSTVGCDFDNNVYTIGVGATRFGSFAGVNYADLPAWQAGTGLDLNSRIV